MRRAVTLLSALTLAATGWAFGTAQAAPVQAGAASDGIRSTSFNSAQQSNTI